jgi:outer membrane protein
MLKHSILVISLICATSAWTSAVVAGDKPQSLADIYNQALAHDPTLASALNANQAAQEIIEQGKALYRPVVNFNAGANASYTDISFTGLKVPFAPGTQAFAGYQYGVEAHQPLYRKQNLVQMDQAKTQVSQADKQLYLTQQTLILRTTQAYFDVLLAQDKIDLMQAQKTAILSQLEQAKANFDAGTVTITDVNDAQARYDLITAQEIAAINDHQIALRAVQAITGEIPQKLATVKTDIKTHALEQGMDKWLEVAAENDLNIQISQDAVKLSEQEVERANAGHLPTVDAVASVTETYASGSFYGFGSDLKNSTIGVQMQLPLYQGGSTSSHVRQALFNKQKAQDDLEIARRQMQQNTQSAYLNLSTSIAQVKAYEQALTSSQSQLDSTKVGYDVGVRTSVDVLNAQQQLFGAKRDLLQARYSYLVNIIRLKAASGVIAETDLADINQQLVLR